MSKGKFVKYLVSGLVVVVLICGVFSIVKRMTGTSSEETVARDNKANQSFVSETKTKKADKKKTDSTGKKETTDKETSDNKTSGKEASDKQTTDKEADNSKPMTSLKVEAPASFIRVGDIMQLKISHEPEDATNTKLKWSCSEKGLVSISDDGVLTPEKNSGRHTVKITAQATDGSKLKETFELRILPEIDLTKPLVAITFDDGPNPKTTNPILDVLEENYVRSTFFLLGKNAALYPETVKREYDLGMEIASHTYSHDNPQDTGKPTFANKSESEQRKEIEDTNAAIEKAGAPAPTLLRPPYGGANSKMYALLKEYNLCCMNWSVDTLDWKGRSADYTYKQVMDQVQDGDVVLLHDIHEYNVGAVQRFIPDLIAKGFQPVTVSELYEAYHKINEGTERNNLDLLSPGTYHERPNPRSGGSTEEVETDSSETSTQSTGSTQNNQ